MGQTGLVTDTARPTGRSEASVNPDSYELADRYRREDGRVFLSGLQAIARLPGDQLRLDRRNGLSTAAFISGYQGSPVGTFGEEVERALRAQVPRGTRRDNASAIIAGRLASSIP